MVIQYVDTALRIMDRNTMVKKLISSLLLALTFTAASAETLIVELKPGAKAEKIFFGKYERLHDSNLYIVQEDIARIKNSKLVKKVEKDSKVAPDYIINDPYRDSWEIPSLNLPAAWDYTLGSTSISVAVLDSGVNLTSEMTGKLLPGYNYYYNNTDTTDYTGHGSLVASSIAGLADNNFGGAGSAPFVKVIPMRITDDNSYGYWSAMTRAITDAANQGAK
jgi:thermitase